ILKDVFFSPWIESAKQIRFGSPLALNVVMSRRFNHTHHYGQFVSRLEGVDGWDEEESERRTTGGEERKRHDTHQDFNYSSQTYNSQNQNVTDTFCHDNTSAPMKYGTQSNTHVYDNRYLGHNQMNSQPQWMEPPRRDQAVQQNLSPSAQQYQYQSQKYPAADTFYHNNTSITPYNKQNQHATDIFYHDNTSAPVPDRHSRRRINSGDGQSSSSSDSSLFGKTNLSSEELKEYVKLIQDLWSKERFVRDFKHYSIKDHHRIRQLLETIDRARRFK
ncbi:hypothetical protein PFISCL1PPCAC_16248, partial [Pristionchus fissidentatus]